MGCYRIVLVLLLSECLYLHESDSSAEQMDVFRNKKLVRYPKPGDLPLLNRKIFEQVFEHRDKGKFSQEILRNNKYDIVRGTRVSIIEHPYVVSIRRLTAHYLTGTLISRNLVLTVAHPLIDVPSSELGVVVGENYSDRGSDLFTVILVLVHEMFDRYTLEADLAILRIYEDLSKQTTVKSVRKLNYRFNWSENVTGFVTGWGRCDVTGEELCLPRSTIYYPGERLDPMLKTVSFRLNSHTEYCKAYEHHNVNVGKGMLCLGLARHESRTTPCLAVPGAPLVVGGRLVGVQSWGFGCGYPNDLPLIYSNIRYYYTWIKKMFNELIYLKHSDILPLYEITKSVVFIGWFEETRILKLKNVSNDEDIQPILADRVLSKLPATVYDIRDFIDDKKYRQAKLKMFQTIQVMQEANQSTPSPKTEKNSEHDLATSSDTSIDYDSEDSDEEDVSLTTSGKQAEGRI